MKKSLILITIAIAISSLPSFAQVSFSVSPGLNLNSANIGYVIGKFNPYVGVQMYSLSEKRKRTNSGNSSTDIYRMTFIMPTLGTKYYLIDKENLKGSIDASAYYVIARDVEIEDGERQDSNTTDLFGVSAMAFEAGFCAEYYFSEVFSIGGEFGYRFGMFLDRYENIATEYYRSDALILNSTYAAFSFNFYF